MGYVTLNLSESELIEGGMLVDQGTEQTRDRNDMMPVTLHEEDLKRGAFVIALRVNDGRFLPFTWKADGHPHQAVQFNGTQEGGTLEQFVYRCAQQAAFAQVHGWEPRVAEHVPRRRYPECPACDQGLGWDGKTVHVEGCPERVDES
jgi:hypothetical protein